MLHKNHTIEILVNGQSVDLESQSSLNLRFNNVLYDPEKISSNQGEYSFEISLPATPKNNKVFDYANNLSKLNKFHSRLDAVVYADGIEIFTGTLIINSYKDKMYNCNLVSVKVYSLDEIFGDSVLTDIQWEIPFEGGGTGDNTINYYNGLSNSPVMFPLISYGAFQKSPYRQDEIAKDYTSKFDLDEYNRWYIESFYPSLNLLETLKKAFEYKGYKVAGDAFQNIYLKDIFMSCNLADEQSPEYNLGNEKFGKVRLSVSWTTPQDTSGITSGATYGTSQELKFPYYRANNEYYDYRYSEEGVKVESEYNLTEARIYDMMSSNDGGSVSMRSATSYMYQPNEHIIVIPADGFYRIKMEYSARLLSTAKITASQWVHNQNSTGGISSGVEEKDIQFTPKFITTCPLEIQLVKNYNDNLELIKGKYNTQYNDGYPDNTTEFNGGVWPNVVNFLGEFPHEMPGFLIELGVGGNRTILPTKWGDLQQKFNYNNLYGYNVGDYDVMVYDPAVSDIFLLGATSMGNANGVGTAAVIKNGYSWSKSHSEKHNSFYNQPGYYEDLGNPTSPIRQQTNVNQNEYINAPHSYHYQSTDRMNGVIYATVELKKNDIIQLFGVHRNYWTTGGTSVSYQTTATVDLEIEAVSSQSYENLLMRGYNYYTPTDFSTNLKVTNFLNKEKKISEWIQNVVDAFNLEIIQDGKNVFLNTKKKINRNFPVAIDIDDRVNSDNAEASRIEYPATMAVKYKIDTEEWGFEKSVSPPEKLNDDDWKDYGDYGYSTIKLSDDSYETSKSEKSLQFSYTYYDNFNWYAVNSNFEKTSNRPVPLRTPVISKYTYMIDGYDYDESMKHDGYGLSQRFWYRPVGTGCYVWTRTYPPQQIGIYTPTNSFTLPGESEASMNLSYKVTEPSLLKEFFNITPYLASNYVTVEVYLTPEEYNSIKNGCLVKFDSDLYIVVDIEGYDASGFSPTEIKMMKKI